MAIDPSVFCLLNVVDTCAVWNCLSVSRLYSEALSANCSFCCVAFVIYECLHKPRKRETAHDTELRKRLRAEIGRGRFTRCDISIDDLQEVAALEARKKLSMGELASVAFAKKTRQAFLTDDQKARRLAETALDRGMVQTTPHLMAWLYFHNKLADHDFEPMVVEHNELKGLLEPHFRVAYKEGLRCRLMARESPPGV